VRRGVVTEPEAVITGSSTDPVTIVVDVDDPAITRGVTPGSAGEPRAQ
jgi:hypothetical protein